MSISIKEREIAIFENGQLFIVKIARDSDGSIWGVYPDYRPSCGSTCVFSDGMRNLLLLVKKGVLKLDDFPRITVKAGRKP